MKTLATITLALGVLTQPLRAQDSTSDAAAYQRAAALVRDGEGDAGRQIVDSLFVRARAGTPPHAEALYWRAALALDSRQAEGDYRRLVVDYPLSPRADRALLALAQLELARNDRERALAHLQRLEREHPAGDARPMAAFWTARILFAMNDVPRACASLDDAGRLVAAEDAELRNQIEFHAARCIGVVRPGTTSSAVTTATTSAVDRRPSAVTTATTSAVDRRPSAVTTQTPATVSTERDTTRRVLPMTPPSDTRPTSTMPAPARVPPPTTPAPVATANGRRPTVYAVQLAAYNTAAEAEALVRRLKGRDIVARVSGTAKPFRVRTGRHATRADANAALRALVARGINGFIVEEPAPPSP